jgi:hypothetical protein
MGENIYIVFEERQLSCDRDYGEDGFIIIWDSEEIGRNISTCELIKEIGKTDDDLYSKVINYILNELELSYGEDDADLNDSYFEEVFEFLEKEIGGGIFYRFFYQTVSFVKEVHKTEESARKSIDYYSNNTSYKNRHYYVRYTVHED